MNIKHTRGLLAATLLIAASVFAQAQSPSSSPKIAPGSLVEPSKTFDAMLSDFEGEFTSAAKAMPADKYNFAPNPSIFASSQNSDYNGVRTFASEITHVTIANYHYASAFGSLKVDVDLKAIDKLTDKDQILAALAASFVFTHKAIANLTTKNAFESVHEPSTRASLAGGVVAHGFDHYGQIVEYLRMNGIVPPASAK